MKTTTKQACQLHSHEAFANGMGLVISVVWYLQADIPVIMHLRHLSVNWVQSSQQLSMGKHPCYYFSKHHHTLSVDAATQGGVHKAIQVTG